MLACTRAGGASSCVHACVFVFSGALCSLIQHFQPRGVEAWPSSGSSSFGAWKKCASLTRCPPPLLDGAGYQCDLVRWRPSTAQQHCWRQSIASWNSSSPATSSSTWPRQRHHPCSVQALARPPAAGCLGSRNKIPLLLLPLFVKTAKSRPGG